MRAHILSAAQGLAVAFAAVLLLFSGRASATEAVILAATVPGYGPGMVVDGHDKLSIPDGASVTLLFRAGGLLRLRGPMESSLDVIQGDQDSVTVSSLAEAFRMRGVDASVVGGTRALDTGRDLHVDEVIVDPQRSGTYCLQRDTTVWIARPEGDLPSFALRRKAMVRRLAWSPGSERAEWPDGFPIEDGDRYEIMTDGRATAMASFRVLSDSAGSGTSRIAEALLLGCREQFAGALAGLARAAVPAELWLTTVRGRDAAFHRLEPINMTVDASVDGYLYCVASLPDSTTVPLFPGDAVDGALLHGSVPMTLPGSRRHFVLQSAVAGTVRVRCWLADRDVSPELPHALLNQSMVPLPENLTDDLNRTFAGLADTRVVAASLDVRVD